MSSEQNSGRVLDTCRAFSFQYLFQNQKLKIHNSEFHVLRTIIRCVTKKSKNRLKAYATEKID